MKKQTKKRVKKLRVGVVGLGHLGSLHALMFSEIPSADFVGVYDIDKKKTDDVAKKAGVKKFSTLRALLDSVEAVSIATPTSVHLEVAREALERGVHVFVEKPVTKTIAEAAELVALASRKKLKVQVGHIERFNPALLAIEPYNLRPMFIESHRLAQFNPRGTDVAVVLDLMIHDIDVIMSLVRSPVSGIEANGLAVVSSSIDIANARIQFENGCVVNVTASRISQKKMRKMRLFQRDAYISVDFLDGVSEVFRLVDPSDKSVTPTMMLGAIDRGSVRRNIVYERPPIPSVNALKVELEQFVRAVQDDTIPLVTGEDGLRALEIASAIIEKIKSQKLPHS